MKITKELLDLALQSGDFWNTCREEIKADKDQLGETLRDNKRVRQLMAMLIMLTVTSPAEHVESGLLALFATGVRLGWHMRELEFLEKSAKS